MNKYLLNDGHRTVELSHPLHAGTFDRSEWRFTSLDGNQTVERSNFERKLHKQIRTDWQCKYQWINENKQNILILSPHSEKRTALTWDIWMHLRNHRHERLTAIWPQWLKVSIHFHYCHTSYVENVHFTVHATRSAWIGSNTRFDTLDMLIHFLWSMLRSDFGTHCALLFLSHLSILKSNALRISLRLFIGKTFV